MSLWVAISQIYMVKKPHVTNHPEFFYKCFTGERIKKWSGTREIKKELWLITQWKCTDLMWTLTQMNCKRKSETIG